MFPSPPIFCKQVISGLTYPRIYLTLHVASLDNAAYLYTVQLYVLRSPENPPFQVQGKELKILRVRVGIEI